MCPPGSDKRELDIPSAAGPAGTHTQRRYYRRWANIFAQLTESTTGAHTNISTATLTTDTLDLIFASLPRSSNNHLEQSATVLNSPMHYLAKEVSDNTPFIRAIAPRKLASKGAFTARPEWIKHPRFLEVASEITNSVLSRST